MSGPRPTESQPLQALIGDDLAGHRADDAVLRSFPGFSRSEVKALFEAGLVRADRRRLKKGDRVPAGVTLTVEAPAAAITPDASIPLTVLFESDDYVIVDKPAGLPTAPLVRTDTRSLAAALLARYPEMAGVGFRDREPGLVHRLDTETSGVVLAARSGGAFKAARALFESALIEKRYLAVCGVGLKPQGEIETLLGPDSSDPRRVRVYDLDSDGYAKPAHTRYRVVESGARFVLVELSVERAFRHQIRAHLAYLGFPIVGDALYGGEGVPELGARHALHGSVIAWDGDAARAGFRGEAPLPAELGRLLETGGAGGA
ncbi:MAG TPA: RluA family pseudouridine synthase [Polyangiaceae bacterium]|nr:RluA family pseudouridine synthase [Polyangiaceae bacterium]